jgi:TonB family protein
MRTIRLTVRYALCMAVFVIVMHAPTSTTELLGQSLFAQQPQSTPTATTPQARSAVPAITPSPEARPDQGLSSDLEKIGTNVRPSVIWVTVFDSKGNLLRTESGFFISADGRFVTTAHATEGAVNAVAKTGDGGIYNVSGVLAASKESDLAILQADVKPRKLVRFLELNKDPDLPVGTGVVAVGSGLAGNEGSPREMTIAAQKADHLELTGPTPPSSVGCPLVNETGAVVGVVTSTGEKTAARSSTALETLLSRVAADTHARWLATAEASTTPKPTPKPRLVFAPTPSFPPGVSQGGVSGTGRFRLSFDSNGNVTNVQVIKSTGNPYFDQAAIKTFRQWKSAPSQGWSVTVPVTFQTR